MYCVCKYRCFYLLRPLHPRLSLINKAFERNALPVAKLLHYPLQGKKDATIVQKVALFPNLTTLPLPMPRLYIVGMVKSTVDNCGHLGRVNPLNRLERSNRHHWEQDQDRWDAKLADRIYRDMQAFIVRRYPGVRWLVLAEVFLTLGSKCAGKAGVDAGEMLEFVIGETQKIGPE